MKKLKKNQTSFKLHQSNMAERELFFRDGTHKFKKKRITKTRFE